MTTQSVKSTMLASGYVEDSTGGGCMTWSKAMPDLSEIWICTEDQGLDGDPAANEWLIGRHDLDCGFVEIKGLHTLFACLAMAEIIPAPKTLGAQNSYDTIQQAVEGER